MLLGWSALTRQKEKFNKAKRRRVPKQDVSLCLPYLCGQSVLDYPCISQQSLGQKDCWEEVNDHSKDYQWADRGPSWC